MTAGLSPDARADLLLPAMTQDEKFALMAGACDPRGHTGFVAGIPRLGIPDLYLNDGPAGVHEERCVPRRQKANGRRRRGRGQWRAFEIEELLPLLVAEAPERESSDCREQGCVGNAGPVGDLSHRRRTERSQVATNDMLESSRLGHGRRSNPGVGESIEIGFTLLPRARWRHANQVDPKPDAVPGDRWKAATREQFPQVSGAPWACRELFAKDGHRGRDIDLSETLAGDAAPPFLAAHPDRGEEEPVVPGRHHVNRAAQQRALNHAPLLERGCQGITPEVAHARPEADISRWRVLRLEATDALDRLDERKGGPFE